MKPKKRKRKNNILVKIIFFLIIACFIWSIITNNEKNQKNELVVLYNNEDKTSEIIYKDKINHEGIYMELQDVQNLFGQEVYIDETNKWIVTLTRSKVAAMNIEESILKVNSAEIRMNEPIIIEEDKYYIPLLELEKVYNVDIEYIEENNRVIIDSKDRELISADVNKKVRVKDETKSLSTTIEIIKKAESVVWISNDNGWAKIRTKNGNIGYVKQKNLANFYTIRENMGINQLDQTTEGKTVNIKALKKVKTIKIEDINKYEARQEIIEKIVDQCIIESISILELQDSLLKEKDEISYTRFEKELKASLAEVGIQLR